MNEGRFSTMGKIIPAKMKLRSSLYSKMEKAIARIATLSGLR